MEELIPIKQEIIDPVSTTEEESIPTAASPLCAPVTEEHVEAKQAESVSSEEDTITKSEEASVYVEEKFLESTTEITPTESEMVQSSPLEDVGSSAETDVLEIPPATDALPAASETSPSETTPETTVATEETPSETKTAAMEDFQVNTGLTVDADITESIETGEISVYEEVEASIISSEAPTIVDAAAEETHANEELASETAPLPIAVEELISFEDTTGPALDAPVQVQTFPDLGLDPLLDPLEDTVPVLTPVAAQEPLQAKPEHNLEPAAPLQAEPEVLYPAAAPAEGTLAEQEAGPEGAKEPAEDLEAELNDEVLNDLDLDNFDLEDIDTTDVNLDEDFLSD